MNPEGGEDEGHEGDVDVEEGLVKGVAEGGECCEDYGYHRYEGLSSKVWLETCCYRRLHQDR